MKQILNSIAASIYVSDLASDDLLYINETGRCRLGYDTPQCFTGKKCFEVLKNNKSVPCTYCAKPLFREQNNALGQLRQWEYHDKTTGTWHHVLDQTIAWDDGRPAYLCTSLDITRSKQQEQQSRNIALSVSELDKQACISSLAGGLSHDINNTMTSILGSISLVKAGGANTATSCRHLAKIETSILDLKEILLKLTLFSRPWAAPKVHVNLEKLIRSCMANVAARAGITSCLEIKTVPETIFTDTFQFRTMMEILLKNASEAMGCGGRLTVTVDVQNIPAESGVLRIAVLDTGCGIPRECMDHIFTPYFSTKAFINGNKAKGLGLCAAKSIATRLGGTIRIDSEPGKGSRAEVILPLESVWGVSTT